MTELRPIEMLDLRAQYVELRDQMDSVWTQVHESSGYVGGSLVSQFEQEFAAYLGVSHVVGVGNGTDALELAVEALQLPSGSTIIVPANSFVATAEAVTRSGHRVQFVDVDETYTIDMGQLEASLHPSVRCVIAVHLYGETVDIQALRTITAPRGISIIEDCAQAHGASLTGSKAGSLGDLAAFSFYPGKNLGAYGDAGAVATNDRVWAERIRRISNHGRLGKFDHDIEGRNTRLDPLQAGVLSVKLRRLDRWVEARNEVADFYDAALEGIGDLVLPVRKDGSVHGQHLYVIQTAQRDALRDYLGTCGIATGIHYPTALPDLPPYRAMEQPSFPVSKRNAERILSLPIHENLKLTDRQRVTQAIRDFFDCTGNSPT